MWSCNKTPKTIVITGVTSGIGKALMKHFLDIGEVVIGIGRSQEKLAIFEQELRSSGLSMHTLICADFSSFLQIDQAIHQINQKYSDGIDCLINNAGMMDQSVTYTCDGFETQFQVNYLAGVKFTHGLLPLLERRKGIVIFSTSNAHKVAKYRSNDLQALHRFHFFRTYARTKLYLLLFVKGFNHKIMEKTGIFACAIHPGLVKTAFGTKATSPLYAWAFRMATRFGITPETAIKGYHDIIYSQRNLLVDYYLQSKPGKSSMAANNINHRDDLWRQTETLLGISFLQE